MHNKKTKNDKIKSLKDTMKDLNMDTIFDQMDTNTKDDFLSKLEVGIRGSRVIYRRIGEAITQEEKNALTELSSQGRYELLSGLDQVGLLDWYYEQKNNL